MPGLPVGNALVVYLVEQGEHEAVIDLPRDTITSGNRIRVPRGSLLPAA